MTGYVVVFEGDDAHFPQFGINIQVLQPGQPNCMYHGENAQEDFLVLSGECVAVLDSGELRIELRSPARGVAPGQAAVLYSGETVLGSATISAAR